MQTNLSQICIFHMYNMHRHLPLPLPESIFLSVCHTHLNSVVHLFWNVQCDTNELNLIHFMCTLCVKLTSFIHNCWFRQNKKDQIYIYGRVIQDVWMVLIPDCQLKWSFFLLLFYAFHRMKCLKLKALCVCMQFSFVNGWSI